MGLGEDQDAVLKVSYRQGLALGEDMVKMPESVRIVLITIAPLPEVN